MKQPMLLKRERDTERDRQTDIQRERNRETDTEIHTAFANRSIIINNCTLVKPANLKH